MDPVSHPSETTWGSPPPQFGETQFCMLVTRRRARDNPARGGWNLVVAFVGFRSASKENQR